MSNENSRELTSEEKVFATKNRLAYYRANNLSLELEEMMRVDKDLRELVNSER